MFASALTWGLQSWGGDASWRTVYLVETAIAVVALTRGRLAYDAGHAPQGGGPPER